MAFRGEDVACMSETENREMALLSESYVSHAIGPVVPYDGQLHLSRCSLLLVCPQSCTDECVAIALAQACISSRPGEATTFFHSHV